MAVPKTINRGLQKKREGVLYMRLNKMRLAAAMMSAVMAASTMSTAVFAEDLIVDEDVVAVVSEGVAVDELVEDQVELAGKVDFNSVSVTEDGIPSWEEDGKRIPGTAEQVTKVSETEATCLQKKSITWKVSLYGKEVEVVEAYGEKADHTWGDKYEVVVKDASCTETGTAKWAHQCKVCKKVEDLDGGATHTISGKNHNYASNPVIVKYENLSPEVQLGANGVPELKDKTQSGTYDKVTYRLCNSCTKEVEQDREPVTLKATDATFDHARIVDKKNITTYLSKVDPDEVDVNTLVLDDCSKPGKYLVRNYGNAEETVVINEYWVEVPAHHTPDVAEITGKTAEDKALINIIKNDKDEIVKVVSKSCHKSATYVETVKCKSATCSLANKIISKTEKTAEPAGAHTEKDSANVAVTALVKVAKATGYADQDAYDDFLAAADAENSGIKYTSSVACGKEGTVTITYLCRECGAEMTDDTVTVKVGKLEHKAAVAKEENKVPATCSAAGSYDLVTRCKYCNKVMETVKVTIPKKNHTYAKDGSNLGIEFKGNIVVDDMYYGGETYLEYAKRLNRLYPLCYNIGTYAYSVVARTYDICTVCGEKVYDVFDPYHYEDDDDSVAYAAQSVDWENAVKVVDVKRGVNGNAGTVTLNATCKVLTQKNKTKTLTTGDVTFPYYTDLVAYIDRNPGNALNGLHLDNDGVYRYYKDGEFQSKFTGIVEFEGGEFFVGNGVLCSGANGLNLYDGTWYMLSAGQIQRGYTGLALYDGEWFYLTDGVLDTNVNRLVAYDGEKFAVAAGRLLQEVNGLWQNPEDGEWYFLALGRAVTEYTGTATYDGKSFELVNGKLVD